MKRLLIVSYASPPQLTAESLLLTRKMRALDRYGWHMTLLTIDPRATGEPLDAKLMEIMPASVEIIRTGSLLRLLFTVRGLQGAIFRTLLHLGLPEKQIIWYLFAVRAGRQLLRNQQFDAIYSHASYHTSNVVGLALKRASGLPWVAHFSDPWLDNPYFRPTPLQKMSCRVLEEVILREAEAIVFTTRQTADIVMGHYPAAWRTKVRVIPHGYESELSEGVDILPRVRKKLRMVYTGSFVPGMRTPEGLLNVLERLSRDRPLREQLEVAFFGQNVLRYQKLVEKMGLDDVVSCRGPIPFGACLQEIAGADVLLLIDAPSQSGSQFLPSKLVDYLAFKKPILGLTPVEGASADLLRRLGYPVVGPDDEPAIMAAVLRLLQLWQHGRLEPSPEIERIAGEYDNMQTTGILDKVITQISKLKSER